MKKRIFCLMIIIFVTAIVDTNASCSSDELKILKEKAKKIEFVQEYEIVEYDDYLIDVAKEAEYKVTAYNLDKDINVIVSYSDEEDGEIRSFKYNDKKSSTLTGFYSGKLKVKMEGNSKNCLGNILRVQYIELLFYNPLFSSMECQEYPEFQYCQSEFTSDYIDNVVFQNKLEKYIKQKEIENEKKDEIDENEDESNGVVKKVLIIVFSIIFIVILCAFGVYYVRKFIKKERKKRRL